MEIWADIDSSYSVSNYGNVKSKARLVTTPYRNSQRVKVWKERLLTLVPTVDGYLRVKLHNKYVSVSHLVATAFIPNPNNFTTVHHKDHDTTNNVVENLEWVNDEEHITMHSNEKQKLVYQYTLNDELVKVWSSTQECGRNGFSQAHVSSCCRGERKTHKSFKWSYKMLI